MDSLADRRDIHRLGRTGTAHRTAILPALDAFWIVDERNHQSGGSGHCFYLMVLPFGIILRIRGSDPLKRQWDPAAVSYRVISDVQDPSQMERPF